MTEQNLIKLNTALSAEIANHIKAFKQQGGKIQIIDSGVSGEVRGFNNRRAGK